MSSSSVLPVVVSASAAVVVALIAAVTAQLRQRQQLAHDKERLETELLHDRTLKDLQELRAVLDEAARDLIRSERALLEIALHYRQSGQDNESVVRRLWDAGEGAWSNSMRLRFRLGEDRIGQAYWEATLAIRDALYITRDAGFDAAHKEALDRFLLHRDEFFAAAYEEVKSRLPPPARPSVENLDH